MGGMPYNQILLQIEEGKYWRFDVHIWWSHYAVEEVLILLAFKLSLSYHWLYLLFPLH